MFLRWYSTRKAQTYRVTNTRNKMWKRACLFFGSIRSATCSEFSPNSAKTTTEFIERKKIAIHFIPRVMHKICMWTSYFLPLYSIAFENITISLLNLKTIKIVLQTEITRIFSIFQYVSIPSKTKHRGHQEMDHPWFYWNHPFLTFAVMEWISSNSRNSFEE